MNGVYVFANDLLPKECPYCDRIVKDKSYKVLPNREYQKSKWHNSCFVRFMSECIIVEGIEDHIDYANKIFDNLPDEFRKLIEKANAREEKERYRYREVVITV
jgi:hypothetical protein